MYSRRQTSMMFLVGASNGAMLFPWIIGRLNFVELGMFARFTRKMHGTRQNTGAAQTT
ncbi:MAG: hypothetical protein WBD56_15170 [Anaerolineales bacterium]